MNAHLYRIPSTYANIPDRIVIRDHALENYPGTWLHAELPLPDGFRALENECGEGFILTAEDEIIKEVFAGQSLIISKDGRAYIGSVSYGTAKTGEIRQRLRWN
nr:MAG TPA: hypothetical protein [Caudoviricetes sp.]